ncbi:MAG: hypothetical protein GXO91_04445 [FCB group bacterium]|nr:hypothetical protein [FCB group bacterium]
MKLNYKLNITFLLLLLSSLAGQIKPTVVIRSGAAPEFCDQVSAVLSEVLLVSNRYHKNMGELSEAKSYFTTEGFAVFTDLVKNTRPYTAKKKYKVTISRLVGRDIYEVRGLKVKVDTGENDVSPVQYLVFALDEKAEIADVRYSLPKNNYREIIDSGEDVVDQERRQKILEFLETFGTAYSRKDADYLENIFSDDALIITGYVTYRKPEFNDLMSQEKNTETEKVVEYRQLTKEQYIKKLRNYVFPSNSYIDIDFSDISLTHHRTMENVYGIKLKQHWKTARYEDTGYLFLTVYFLANNDPLVLVRVWQDQDFMGDYDVSIYDFDIIE